jgi:hypothetical protein
MDGYWVAMLFGIGAICGLLGFVAYLRFLTFIVKHTGDTKGLRDAAIAARAFPLARGVRLVARPRRIAPLELGAAREEVDERVVLPLELEEPTERPEIGPLSGNARVQMVFSCGLAHLVRVDLSSPRCAIGPLKNRSSAAW